MLDWKVETSSDWADVTAEHGQCLSFQRVEGYATPTWPTQDAPQQMHLDVMVDRSGTPSASASASPDGRRQPVAAAARSAASSVGLVSIGQWPESMSTSSTCLAWESSGASPASIHS